MQIYPAIDLLGGQVVRLTEGDYDQVRAYGLDPVETALGFAAAGAKNLHVVDLDGAKEGTPRNFDVLKRLAAETGLFIETGGGIRTPARVADVLALGVSRVILGTAALRNPAFLKDMLAQYGDKIAVGVDARDGKVAVGGWLEVSDTDAMAFCAQLRDMGVKTVIYTDIARDGQLAGTNLDAYRSLRQVDGLDVIASGGITGEDEIAALRDMGTYGAIVGKALYEGRLDLARVLQIAREEPA